jgi:hypothetical protein
MKRTTRWMVAGLALVAVLATGCIITSAQILAHFDLDNPVHIDASDSYERVAVDLAVDVGSDYTDNKDKLEGLTDLAILGTFVNSTPGTPAGQVTCYITAGNTTYANGGEVLSASDAVVLWGPASIGAEGTPDGTVTLDWDASAALFNTVGKQVLIDEAKGDGQFTLYFVGTSFTGGYDIEIQDGKVVLVLDAGQ